MARHDITHTASCLHVIGILIVVAAHDAAAQPVVFRNGVDMVPLTVTVTDRSGGPVTGLGRADFSVLEDGVPQTLAFFAAGTVPVDVALVLDASGSMAADMPLVRTAALGLIRSLRPGDRGAVVAVNTAVVIPQGLTGNLDDVAAAIEAVPNSGSTALYDGLYIALRELSRARRDQTEVRRQVLVLLSDGMDNASHVSAEDVADAARRVGAGIYVVALADPRLPSNESRLRRSKERALFDMQMLARDTGARTFRPRTPKELPAIYGTIARELASQYDLGYVPENTSGDGVFRRVTVRVLPSPDVVARTRSGYYADRGPAPGRPSTGPSRD